MRKLALLLLLGILCGSCSRWFFSKKVECCEKTAVCCHEQMCCLPRYAKAAGQEPKVFTPEVPVYGLAQDLEPKPGETVNKPGKLSRLNPFARSEKEGSQESTSAEPENKGFFRRWLHF